MQGADGQDGGAGRADDDPNEFGGLNDYADSKGPLSQWIQKPEVVRFIMRQFENFIKTFRDM